MIKEIDDKKKKELVIGYIVTISLTIILVIIMMVIKGGFKADSTKEFFHLLSDSFFVPGVLIAGVGGLSFLASLGAYDSFGYFFSRFSLHNLFFTNPKKDKYDSLYDYKKKKEEKGRHWLPYALWTGLGAIGVSILLVVIYLML